MILVSLLNVCVCVYIYNTSVCSTQVKIKVSKEALGGIPIWVIIISILIGLLILALAIFVLWKVTFLEFIKQSQNEQRVKITAFTMFVGLTVC